MKEMKMLKKSETLNMKKYVYELNPKESLKFLEGEYHNLKILCIRMELF